MNWFHVKILEFPHSVLSLFVNHFITLKPNESEINVFCKHVTFTNFCQTIDLQFFCRWGPKIIVEIYLGLILRFTNKRPNGKWMPNAEKPKMNDAMWYVRKSTNLMKINYLFSWDNAKQHAKKSEIWIQRWNLLLFFFVK